jgi:hypothetical protein
VDFSFVLFGTVEHKKINSLTKPDEASRLLERQQERFQATMS